MAKKGAKKEKAKKPEKGVKKETIKPKSTKSKKKVETKKPEAEENQQKPSPTRGCNLSTLFDITKYPFLKEALNGEKLHELHKELKTLEKNAPSYSYLSNLLSKNIHTFNPRSKNRWKLVAQIESKTRNISQKCSIELLNMMFFTGLFNVMRDSMDVLGTTSSPRKCIQKADIDFIFDILYPQKYQKKELFFYCLLDNRIKFLCSIARCNKFEFSFHPTHQHCALS